MRFFPIIFSIEIPIKQWLLSWPLAVNDLIQALNNADDYLRALVAETLGDIGGYQAVEPLIKLLQDDKDYYVREIAAWSLGKLADARAVSALIFAMRGDEEEWVKDNVEWALTQIGGPAVEPLITALQDKSDTNKRERIAYVLGQIGDMRAFEPLIKLLQDENAGVRAHAVGALRLLNNAQAVPAVRALLNDPDDFVRKLAQKTLHHLQTGSES